MQMKWVQLMRLELDRQKMVRSWLTYFPKEMELRSTQRSTQCSVQRRLQMKLTALVLLPEQVAPRLRCQLLILGGNEVLPFVLPGQQPAPLIDRGPR